MLTLWTRWGETLCLHVHPCRVRTITEKALRHAPPWPTAHFPACLVLFTTKVKAARAEVAQLAATLDTVLRELALPPRQYGPREVCASGPRHGPQSRGEHGARNTCHAAGHMASTLSLPSSGGELEGDGAHPTVAVNREGNPIQFKRSQLECVPCSGGGGSGGTPGACLRTALGRAAID